jgi:replicative DNA helicase
MEILATLHGPLPDSADGRDPFAIKQELVSTHLARLGTLASSRLAQIENLVAIVDDGKETGAVQSGFGGIDKVMSIGGIPKGQLTVVRAHHKGGKSLLMRSMFYRDITQGIRALYVTFADISKIQLKRLLIQADTGERRTPRTLDKLETYDASVKFFHDHFAPNGYIIDAFGVSEDTSIEDITEAIKNFHKEHRFDKIYLDYAQKISSRDPKARAGSIAEFDVVCRKLANFFHHLGVACVVGSQTTGANKATGDRAKTKLGRRLEEEAGLVLHVTKDMHNIEIEIVYNRWGEASVDGGSKKLVIGKLTHNYEKHIIEGEGVPEWKDGDSSEPYIPRAA